MSCPYCHGEIPEDARACQHCGRDVALVLSMQRRIRELEEEVARFAARPHAGSQRGPTRATSLSWRWIFTLSAGWAVAAVACIGWAKSFDSDTAGVAGLLMIPAAPLLLGTWIGLRSGRIEARRCAAVGMFFSIVLVAGIDTLDRLEGHGQNLFELLKLISLFGMGLSLLSLASGVTFGWIRGKLSGQRNEDTRARQVAVRLVHRGKPHGPGYEMRLERMTKVLTAIGPIATAVATLVGAWVTYLGTRGVGN